MQGRGNVNLKWNEVVLIKETKGEKTKDLKNKSTYSNLRYSKPNAKFTESVSRTHWYSNALKKCLISDKRLDNNNTTQNDERLGAGARKTF